MILVVGTCGKGGILSVITAIASTELAKSWGLVFIPSHDSVNLLKRVWLAAKAGIEICYLCVTNDVRLMHLHSAMRGSFWRKAIYMEMGHFLGIPSILHLHGSEMKVFYEQQGVFGRRLVRRSLHKADRVVVLSESWRSFVLSVAPQARVEMVFNFVPLQLGITPKLRRPGESLRVAFLGLIGDRKGIFDLVKAVAGLLANRPGCLQLVVGGNGEMARLAQAIIDAGLKEQVQVLGWIDAQARADLLRSIHAFALPSYNEGLPMALLEAMSYGIPVLSTPVGGIPELVQDGLTGYLIEPGDTVAMMERLGHWLDDDNARVQMGLAAQRRVACNFSEEQAVKRLDTLYAVLSSRGQHVGQE